MSSFADAATFEHERQKTEFPAHSTILESPEKDSKPLIEGMLAADQVFYTLSLLPRCTSTPLALLYFNCVRFGGWGWAFEGQGFGVWGLFF